MKCFLVIEKIVMNTFCLKLYMYLYIFKIKFTKLGYFKKYLNFYGAKILSKKIWENN